MNIFYTHSDPIDCALDHCKTHNRKMIIEYCQMLSTAHRVLDGSPRSIKQNGRNKIIYVHPEPTMDSTLTLVSHINHPCSVWVRSSEANYRWLLDVYNMLCEIYFDFKGTQHKTDTVRSESVNKIPKNIATAIFTTPPVTAPSHIISLATTIGNEKAYQQFIVEKLNDWTTRTDKRRVDTTFYFEPTWLPESLGE